MCVLCVVCVCVCVVCVCVSEHNVCVGGQNNVIIDNNVLSIIEHNCYTWNMPPFRAR